MACHLFSMREMLILVTIIVLQEILFVHGHGNSFNLAEGKPTSSSTGTWKSKRAVDGDRNPDFFALSCWKSAYNDWNPYWMVDLGREFNITHVSVTNRADCCAERLHDFVIDACLENPEQVPAALCFLCYNYIGQVASGAIEYLHCTKLFVRGRYVRIRRSNKQDFSETFTLCEVEVYDKIDSSFETSFRRQSSSRSNGSVAVITKTARADCTSMCVRHPICVAFKLQHRQRFV